MSTEGLDLNRMLGSIMEQARTVQGRMSEVQERRDPAWRRRWLSINHSVVLHQ